MEFEFVAGHVVLDFVATVAERTTSRRERLLSPADLGEWLAGAGVLDSPPDADDADLAAARDLRESLYALVRHLTGGPAPGRPDRERLNRLAAGTAITVQADSRWVVHRSGGIPAALAYLAQQGLLLAEHGQRDAIRWCAGVNCTRPFLDRSHARRRRWCGMSTCGDKVKAATYRARRAESSKR